MADVASEIAEIEQSMSEDIDGYFKDGVKQERYSQLIAAQEAGTAAPAGPSENEQRIGALEKMMAEPMNESRYWKDPALQSEYRALIGGGEPATELGEALGITEDQALDMQERVGSAFEGVDTQDLDIAFQGLSDGAQSLAVSMLADPSQRWTYFDSVDDATLTELGHFIEGLPEPEWEAVQRALVL